LDGGAVGAVLGARSRVVSALSGAALLAACALTRFGIYHGGVHSAEDPRYSVVPQRKRLAAAGTRGAAASGAGSAAGSEGVVWRRRESEPSS
jgi:hypothetical protein